MHAIIGRADVHELCVRLCTAVGMGTPVSEALQDFHLWLTQFLCLLPDAHDRQDFVDYVREELRQKRLIYKYRAIYRGKTLMERECRWLFEQMNWELDHRSPKGGLFLRVV
ncbi:hypothetical protein GC167_02120 [bacterium]|nr:hypothetical protein [bacterium]